MSGAGQIGAPRGFVQLPQVGQDAQRDVFPPPSVAPLVVALIPRGLVNWAIITGGVAVIAAVGPINGGFITNPVNAAAQGIGAAENLYLNMVGAPGATDALANGATVLLQPGQTFYLPPLALGVLVQINAASSGHLVSGEVW